MSAPRLRFLDGHLLTVVGALCAMGLLTVYSAGRGTSQSGLWIKQGAFFGLGFLLMLLFTALPTKRAFGWSLAVYLLALLLLGLVLGMPKIQGTHRWIAVGTFTLQPSELAKWATLLFVSHRLGRRSPEQLGGWELLGTVALVLFPMLLVLKEPDLGMALSFLPILMVIPLMRGLKARWVVVGLLLMALGGVAAWKWVLKPYQKQRVEIFLDPESDLKGKGYQTHQSRIAIGSGGFFGKGFTSGSQTQLNFLPVKTTDFVFSVWAEERGFLGVALALGLFGTFLLRLLDTAKRARDLASLYFCVGAASIFTLHLLVNVAMVAGALPNKGIALPFFSYGGSSTLSFFLALGLVMAIRREATQR